MTTPLLRPPVEGCPSWDVPVNGQLHKVNFYHNFNRSYGMDLNGENATVINEPNAIKLLFNKKSISPKKGFKFGDLQLDVWVFDLWDNYVYALDVNNLSLKMYKKEYYKKFNVWKFEVDGKEWRVVLDKNTLEMYGNGEKLDDARTTFAENNGVFANFLLGTAKCSIEIEGDKSAGITHNLLVDGEEVPLDIDLDEQLYRRLDKFKQTMGRVGIM